ncbi:DUF2339 domain-containing protein [Actinocrispum wychmicini]|uniref:Putative membrane protein DUF2339 n=1 Tax=Actinocrispum wychmicini TaxID=1213861 RepID=A0A4R2JDV0_9PSEU|nr:DUF2339 domain-containing protein [Actinocrispum wychmicini]TCO55016.1 putative membrane protein DUF2339 [Actinocrispum wychmicini]
MDALHRLADEVAQLGRRLELISAELRSYTQDELTRPIARPTPVTYPAPPPVLPPPGYQAYVPPPRGPSLMERLGRDGAGSRLLAWVGGVVTLLGVVLLLVLAVQRGWLGPPGRVLGGAVLGAALVGSGLWAYRSPYGRSGAFALAATGVAALYLDTIAATTLFHYLPEWGGLVVGLAVAVGGLLLAARWDSPMLGTAVVIGCAALAPFITEGFTPELVTFLLMLQIATTPVQLRKTWPSVALVGGSAPLVASMITTARTHVVDPLPSAFVALAALVVGAVLAVISSRRGGNDQVALGLLVWAAAPVLFSALFLPKWQAVAVAGAAAAVMLCVWVITPMKNAAAIGTLVSAFQATATAFDGSARSVALMGAAVLLAVLALALRDQPTLWGAVGFGAAGAALAFVKDVPPTFLVVEPTSAPSGLVASLFSSLLVVAVAVALPWVATAMGVLEPASKALAPWLFAGAAALYGAAGFVLSAALLIEPDRSGFLLGHVVITVSWTVAALMLLLKGIAVRALRVVGLVLVGAAVLKLVLFDLSALDGMARVAAFLCAGLILLAAGTRYARLVSRL